MEARLPSTALAIWLLCEAAWHSQPVSSTELCSTTRQSPNRLDPLLSALLEHELLSHDAAGYSLARSPASITVAEIAVAVDGASALALDSSTPLSVRCLISDALDEAMKRLTLADFLEPGAGRLSPPVRFAPLERVADKA